MSVLAFTMACLGLSAMCLSMNRHARDLIQRELPRAQRLALRLAGGSALALSLWLATARSGWPVGIVEWFGMLTAGALGLVFLLSYFPKIAAILALLLPLLAAAAAVLA